ncbi:hypothetical protein IM697_10230 [Streptomyces ferrugineus]|uniref:Uncharacterized protein n=1 Tax=Streptomyces ferrugineus TaxID=1413221 RepID=A0A7M2SQS1_9ACTN|nr:hypothetical protein [Streptomyces ferrugineus]QOV38710.1 hypothetical protein IM697_10230 [Streptomyces ferrugineus]
MARPGIEAAAGELGVLLRTRDHAAVPVILDRLDALAAGVVRSEADRTVALGILHGKIDSATDKGESPRLTERDLPRVSSVSTRRTGHWRT